LAHAVSIIASSSSRSVANWFTATTGSKPKARTLVDVLLEVGEAAFQCGERLRACNFPSESPPWNRSARAVATSTTARGQMFAERHLMSKNFSAPRSNPNPASVTT